MGPCLVLFFEALLALSVVALLTPFVTTSCTYCGKKSKKEKRMGKALPDVTRRSVQPVHEGKLEELAKTEKTQEETEATQENSMPLSPIIESKE
ncbi:hypothetical protein QR680_012783 [Steinernema hermaphroditum]|uniref:Uncharacterized protein n=1 Tax=Steinernema hermaphroditum TaxID=289476 RepID=A0AA39I5R3_9BILA|nr:hypothetical protein QR680_012783 [Steinernema hermaphroditum]